MKSLISTRYLSVFVGLSLVFFMNCGGGQSATPDAASQKYVKKYVAKYVQRAVKRQNLVIDTLNIQISQLESEIGSLKNGQGLTGANGVSSNIAKMGNKVKILEDRATFSDSLYFEILNELVLIENKIESLKNSYKEMTQLQSTGRITEIPKIKDEDYRGDYIEALSSYQNGEFAKSLEKFNYLILADASHDLADNCQYWIGEIYYSMKDYKRAIQEFEKVFSFAGTNKDDDSQYKLGLCYINIGNKERAKDELRRLLDYYPNSEYYLKSKQLIENINLN
jgi:TolA-binding protein